MAQYGQKKDTQRHDRVWSTTFTIFMETWLKLDKKHWNEHAPKSAETSHESKITISWNQHVKTVRTIPNYKPVIIICDNEKGTCLLIDNAFEINKEAENILTLQYINLTLQYTACGM